MCLPNPRACRNRRSRSQRNIECRALLISPRLVAWSTHADSESSKEATCSYLPGCHDTVAPNSKPHSTAWVRGIYLALSSQYSYSTMCDRRTPADESQCFLVEPVWSASDHDACFREDDWRYPLIFHSEKVNRVWGPKGERTADSHPAV